MSVENEIRTLYGGNIGTHRKISKMLFGGKFYKAEFLNGFLTIVLKGSVNDDQQIVNALLSKYQQNFGSKIIIKYLNI